MGGKVLESIRVRGVEFKFKGVGFCWRGSDFEALGFRDSL